MVAYSCVVECLQVLATLANLSTALATKVPTFEGAITALARVMLRRHEFLTSVNVQEVGGSKNPEMVDVGKDDDTVDFIGPARYVTPDDLLCLVLAILTTLVMSSGDAAETIASTSLYCLHFSCPI